MEKRVKHFTVNTIIKSMKRLRVSPISSSKELLNNFGNCSSLAHDEQSNAQHK